VSERPLTEEGDALPTGASDATGLSNDDVADRVARGLTNAVPSPTSRTYGQILRANVFTRFNALLGVLLVAILAVGEYRDALFGLVLVANALIGIIQESRSKRSLDRLTLLSAPRVFVRRHGDELEVANDDVVLDDVVVLRPGDQVTVDGDVLASDGMEIDESLLTGEADPVVKQIGDAVLSGSFVSAGSGVVRATAVGVESYAQKIGSDARRFTLVRSELRDGINSLVRIVQWMMIPTAFLLVASQIRADDSDLVRVVQGSVAGLVAMVPEGLVLLTSTALAIGVIRLGRRQVLTQELAAIEGLARVDVLCIDKTGTLTEGRLTLADVEPVGSVDSASFPDPRGVLASMAAADPNPNPSLRAIAEGVQPGAPGNGGPATVVVPATTTVPFSSARKWSAAALDGQGAWYLGAPDVLLAGQSPSVTTARVEELSAEGRRVLLLAHSPGGLDGERLPDGLGPVALCVLDETIRAEAPDTIAWFGRQGVTVKVISGDNPTTVAAVARRVGVPGADAPVDARTLPEDLDELAEIMETSQVFGRVTPHQKRAMVHALQSRGHEVAMTGDGVNDTLALKDADIGVAMGSGSPAARAVARFVLLANDFAVFPAVVAEGRRVIANVERVANLFLTKTFYALILAIATGVVGVTYPFVPRHLTLISSLTIGIPGFFLALAPNETRARPGFLPRVLRFAIPAGVIAALGTFAGYVLARAQTSSLVESQTTAVIVLFVIAFWVLGMLARPYAGWRLGLVTVMAVLFAAALFVPPVSAFFDLDLPALDVLAESLVLAGLACVLLEFGLRLARWRLPDTFAGVGGSAFEDTPADHDQQRADGRGTGHVT
jgi:cation-transporting P-type ATPase E